MTGGKILFKTVKTKLIATLLCVALLPLLIVGLVLYLKTNEGFSQIISDNQVATNATVTNQLTNVTNDLLQLTESYATNQALLEAIQSGNREEVAAIIEPIYERLEQEHQVSVFEIGDNDGTVFFRGHNPEKFGDDKSDTPAIAAALDGESIAGFEFGSSGLSARAFAPLQVGGTTIGTLQLGLDSSVISSIAQSLGGIQISMADLEGTILVSTDESQIGNQFTNEEAMATVTGGKELTTKEGSYLKHYMPLYDPTHTEVIGLTEIASDIGAVIGIQQEVLNFVLVIGVATLIIVGVIAFLLSRAFSRPITKLTGIMNEMSKGNLNHTWSGKMPKDEFGQLAVAMMETQAHLKEMIEKILEHSMLVKEQSSTMKQAFGEINIGTEQMAATMEELSSGAEQQADTSSVLDQHMDDFAHRIVETVEVGAVVSESSKEVLNVTETGNSLMGQSMDQMKKIHQLMTESVRKVGELDVQSREISQLVNVVQGIAEQTNLLALNAAIEAARAGEHGKGFAVVADEVRKLAEQVSQSVGEITQNVQNIQDGSVNVAQSLTIGYGQIGEGIQLIEATGESFKTIQSAVTNMAEQIDKMTTNLSVINNNSMNIKTSITNVAAISEESAAAIEETTASVQETSISIDNLTTNIQTLEEQSETLQETVKKFTI